MAITDINNIVIDMGQMKGRWLRFISAALVVGVVTGVCAFLLKTAIKWVSHLLTGGLSPEGANWQFLVIPVVGILLTAIFMRYLLKHNIENGVDHVSQRLKTGNVDMPWYLVWSPLLASTITLGFGGSAGSEGPIASTGAAIGSNVGRKFGLTASNLKLMVAIGAGAGIAGIFKSPVGGMLFVLEYLKVTMSSQFVMILLACCLASGFTAYLLSGCTPDMLFTQSGTIGPSDYPLVILLGIFCGLYSLWYSYSGQRTRTLLRKIPNAWVGNVVSGLILAAGVFFFPMLYGEGYTSMSHIVNGNASAMVSHTLLAHSGSGIGVLLLVAAGMLAVKGIAAYATNSRGGVAGEFAPTLFAGCIAGYFFANGFGVVTGHEVNIGILAFLAMAGVMAGVIKAPFMAVFITVEMAGVFDLLFPVALVAFTSYGIVRLASVIHRPAADSKSV